MKWFAKRRILQLIPAPTGLMRVAPWLVYDRATGDPTRAPVGVTKLPVLALALVECWDAVDSEERRPGPAARSIRRCIEVVTQEFWDYDGGANTLDESDSESPDYFGVFTPEQINTAEYVQALSDWETNARERHITRQAQRVKS